MTDLTAQQREFSASVPHREGSGGFAVYWQKHASKMETAPYAALVLRLMLGFFFWVHLYNKFIRDGFESWWSTFRPIYPAFVLIYVLTAEFSGALFIPLGLRTRWVALWTVPSFLGVSQYWFHKGGYAFSNPGAEFPIMWLCMLVLQIILGDGAYSLKMTRRRAADA